MKLNLPARFIRACLITLMMSTLTSASAVWGRESTVLPAAPLKAAMDELSSLSYFTTEEKNLIQTLPDIIASVIASKEGVSSDFVPEAEYNLAEVADNLQVLDDKLATLQKSADSALGHHINVLRKTINLIIDVVTLTQEPDIDSPTAVTRQVEGMVDLVREKINDLKRYLLRIQSIVEIISSTIDIFSGSIFPSIDSSLDSISSKLMVIESKADACCEETQSKLNVIDSKDDVIISLLEGISSNVEIIDSKIDMCCPISKIDIVLSLVEDLACCAPTPLPDPVGGVITVSAPGSYCLCDNTCAQLVIDASDVCVDLGCHTLAFDSSSGSVVTINDGLINVTIHNGSLAGTCVRSPSSESFKRYDEKGSLKPVVRGPVTSCGNDGITIGEDCTGILIKDMTIDSVNCQGIHFNVGCSDITIRNAAISGAGETGILVEGDGANASIEEVTIHDCGIHGIHFFTSTDLSVKNALIQNADPGNLAGGAAICLEGADSSTFSQNCALENISTVSCGTGLKFRFARNVAVSRSTFKDSFLYGIFSLENTENISIDSVTIEQVSANTSGDGIFVENGASIWSISNTTIQDCLGNGINLDGNGSTINDFAINNVTILGCADDGILIVNSDNICVKNSTISGNGLNTSSAKGGIEVESGNSCNFVQCKVTGNGGTPAFGFSLEDCTRCTVLQCLVTNNTSTGASSGILINGASTDNDIRNNSVTHNTSGTNTSVGINHQSGSSTNKFFGNYVCGHDTEYVGVSFIGDLTNASPYHNVTCENTGTDHIQELDSKLDLICSKIMAMDLEINSKLDIILNGTC